MTKEALNPLYAALVSLGLAATSPALLAEQPAPSGAQEQTPVAESVRPQVEKETADEALERREKIVSEATSAITQTKNALAALEEGKVDDALKALEIATGKLELILARDPDLGLAPVDVSVVTYDLVANPETVKQMIDEAEEYLEDGEIQKARPLVASLASETVLQTTSIPLATYPDAIKSVAPLIDEDKIAEAKAALQTALNTLVVTTDEVIPLPILRAEHLLTEAETLAENEERISEESERLAELLEETRSQLEMAQLLGYATEDSVEAMYAQLNEIEERTAGGEGGTGWFDKIQQQIAELF